MKINWGWKIAIGYTLFVIGILTLVFKARSSKVELVTADYYAQELQYQKRLEMMNNTMRLSKPIQIKQSSEGVELTWPDEITTDATGKIEIYRPSDAALDREVEIHLSDLRTQAIPSSLFSKGLYILKIRWQCNGTNYFLENPIMIE